MLPTGEAEKAGKFRGRVGYPQLKSRKHSAGSFRLSGVIKELDGQIQLTRLGLLKLKKNGCFHALNSILE